MWQDFFSAHLSYKAVFDIVTILMIGLAVKITDDYIDQDDDEKKSIWLKKLGKGVLPYTVILILLSVNLNYYLATGLYISAFIVGMFKEPKTSFPLGMNGILEIIIFCIVGHFLVGFSNMVMYILLMLLVQFIDDLIDYKKDKIIALKNIFICIGLIEGLILLTILLILNLVLQPFYCVVVLVALFLINKLSV